MGFKDTKFAAGLYPSIEEAIYEHVGDMVTMNVKPFLCRTFSKQCEMKGSCTIRLDNFLGRYSYCVGHHHNVNDTQRANTCGTEYFENCNFDS